MFVLNDAVDTVPVVTNIFAFSPAPNPVTLKCVVALFANVTVKKLPAFISIDAVLLATVTATILPCAEPVIMIEPDMIAEPVNGKSDVVNPDVPEVPDVPAAPVVPVAPVAPAAPEVPEVPDVPAVTLEPDTTYIVFGSVCPAVIKLANEAELKVTMLVTAGTFVYISYMLDTKLPLNPPTNCDIEPVTPNEPVI